MLDCESNEILKIRRESIKVFRKKQKDIFLNRNRGSVADNKDEEISVEKMKKLTGELTKLNFKGTNAEKRLSLLSQIKMGACFGDKYIEPCLHGYVLHCIIHSLQILKNPQCQLEAAACLTNFAGGSHQISMRVASKAGPFLIEFISCSNPELQAQCIWAVTNICNDCEVCFLVLKQHGLISSLLVQLESPYPVVVKSVTCALIACTNYEDHHLELSSITKVAHLLLHSLKSNSVNKLNRNALYILSNIYSRIIDSELGTLVKEIFNITLEYFINAVSGEELDMQVATTCIRCLGIATAFSYDFCVALATNKTFGNCVLKVLYCQHSHIKKEILWVLINIFTCVNIGIPDFFIDLQYLMQSIALFVCPLDDKILMVMQLLCTLLARDENCKQFVDDTLYKQVQVLKQCDRQDLKNVACIFDMLIGSKYLCIKSN